MKKRSRNTIRNICEAVVLVGIVLALILPGPALVANIAEAENQAFVTKPTIEADSDLCRLEKNEDYKDVAQKNFHKALDDSTVIHIPKATSTSVTITVQVDENWEEASWDLYKLDFGYILIDQRFDNGGQVQTKVLDLSAGEYWVNCLDELGNGGISGEVKIGDTTLVSWGAYEYTYYGQFMFEIGDAPEIFSVDPVNTVDADGDRKYEYWEFEVDIDASDASSGGTAEDVYIIISDDEGNNWGTEGPYDFQGSSTSDNVILSNPDWASDYYGFDSPQDVVFTFYAYNFYGDDTKIRGVSVDGQISGIDVSHHQGSIDWYDVSGAGYRFAFVKATEGATEVDSNFIINMDDGNAAGLLMGAYHFAYPEGGDAVDEAEHFVNVAEDYLDVGYLRPALDLEENPGGLSWADLSQWVHDWMDTVESLTRVEPIIYVNPNYATNLDASVNQYDLWICDISQSPPRTGIWSDWAFWQYSWTGSVPGIAGDVDLDQFYGDTFDLERDFVITQADLNAEWTFMVYLDGDNDLEEAAIEDFLEMSSVGSNSDINIVVQFDRHSDHSNAYGDWTSTKRYLVGPGMDPTSANALSDIGEANMGHPQTLINFATWAIDNYPANQYCLVLWDHGSGCLEKSRSGSPPPVKGVCWDDTNGGDVLTLSELESAMNTIRGHLGRTIDIVGFDACLMGMIEVYYQLRDTVAITIGSEEVEPGDGWPFDDILSALAADPTMAPSTLASAVVTSYMDFYGYGDEQTMAAFDVSRLVNHLVPSVDVFSQCLLANVDTAYLDIFDAREDTEYFDHAFDEYIFYVDLYDFADELMTLVDPAGDLSSAASDVMTEISSACIAEGHGNDRSDAHGLSIYWEVRCEDEYNDEYDTLDFAADTGWDEFLKRFYTDAYEDDDVLADATPISVDGTPQFHNFDVDSDQDWVSFSVSDERAYLIEAEDLGHDSDAYLSLYYADGTLLADEDSELGTINEVLSPGDYCVKADSYFDECGPNTYYALSVWDGIDRTPPEINDHTFGQATTGDPFTFEAWVTDNVGVSGVFVEYWYGEGDHTTLPMELLYGIIYLKEIEVPHTTEDLWYNISACDEAGHWAYTGERSVWVIDNDPPSIDSLTGDTTGLPGGTVTIDVTFSDNIGVTVATLFYRSESAETWYSKSILSGSADICIPSDPIEYWYYYVTVNDEDDSGPVGDPSVDGSVYYTIYVGDTFVDDNFDSSTPGWGVTHFDTIQDAIDYTREGGIVTVYSGTYVENVVVAQSLDLVSLDRDTTIIDGGGTGDVVYVSADWVNISGFTIQNSGDYEDNHFPPNNFDAGIEVSFSSHNTITGNKIIADNKVGVFTCYSDNTTVSENNILNNEYGIYFKNANYNLVSGNHISDNILFGIWFYNSKHNIVSGNHITNPVDPYTVGFLLQENSWSNIIGGNSITKYSTGLTLEGSGHNPSNNTIIGNTIIENDLGINLLSSSFSNTIMENNIMHNTYGIGLSWSTNKNIIYHNNFVNNSEDHAYDTGDGNRWYNETLHEGNYWDDYAGVDLSPKDGIGDTPYTFDGGDGGQDEYPLIDPYGPTLVARWYFDEGTGQIAFDSSGNNHNAQLGSSGGADDNDPVWKTGVSGDALKFNGNDYVEHPDIVFDISEPWTFSMWHYVPSGLSSYSWRGFIGATIGSDGGYWLYHFEDKKLVFYQDWFVDEHGEHYYMWASELRLGEEIPFDSWTYITVTCEPVDATRIHLTVYVNGGQHTAETIFECSPRVTQFTFRTIGKGRSCNANQFFKGKIDEVRIYNRGLSEDEIRTHYEKYTLNGCWHFDEGEGQIAFDSSGNNNHGQLGSTPEQDINDPERTTDGVSGNALYFDGSDDYVNITDSDSFNGVSITISAWIKFDEILTNMYPGIVFKRQQFQFVFDGPAQKLWFGLWGDSLRSTKTDWNIGQWYHVAVTFEDTTDTAIIYINGEVDNTGTVSESNDPSNKNLYIGYKPDCPDGYDGYFDGTIDEVRIYSRVLSEDEIHTHFLDLVGQIDPSLSFASLTDENQGLTTCPAGDGPTNQITITVRNHAGEALPGIPASDFGFAMWWNVALLQWYGWPTCTFTAVDPGTTDMNGEIRFEVTGDTSLVGIFFLDVYVRGVHLNDVPAFQCNSFDLNLDGNVNLVDFGIFASDFLTPNQRSDFNWDDIVSLPDLGGFASHFSHSFD